MAIIKNKGETVLNHKLFLEINILKIVKYLVKYIFLIISGYSECFHNDATDRQNKCFLRILKQASTSQYQWEKVKKRSSVCQVYIFPNYLQQLQLLHSKRLLVK